MVVGGLLANDRGDHSGDAAEFNVENVVDGLSRGTADGEGDLAGRLDGDVDEPQLRGGGDKGESCFRGSGEVSDPTSGNYHPMTSAPMLPNYLGIPFRILVSPLINFNAETRETDVLMFNSKNLGALVQEDPHVRSWEDGQSNMNHMSIEETYGFGILTRRSGNRGGEEREDPPERVHDAGTLVLQPVGGSGIGIIQAPRIRLRKENRRTAVWDARMEEKLLKVAGQLLRDVFLLSHDSGMRPDEIIRLRWEDILWDRNLIFAQEGKIRKATRYVPLSERATSHKAIEKPFRQARERLDYRASSSCTRHATALPQTFWIRPAISR